jgi:hypothetical protein
MLEEMKAYAHLVLENYKLQRTVAEATNELADLHSRIDTEYISINELRDMFTVYDKDGMYLNDESKPKLYDYLQGEADEKDCRA